MENRKYRVYTELYDDNGNIVHKTPICSTSTLKLACSMARTNAGLFPVGIYEIKPDGTEIKVM